jgi:hypothetical protein
VRESEQWSERLAFDVSPEDNDFARRCQVAEAWAAFCADGGQRGGPSSQAGLP